MNARIASIITVALLAFSVSAARADEYSDTVNLFKNAGESAAFYKTRLRVRRISHDRQRRRGRRRRLRQGPRVCGGKHVGDTSMTQVTVGLQLGGQAYSEMIFFEDERSLKEFTGGNFEFGAEASAVAITAAANAKREHDRFVGGCQRRQEGRENRRHLLQGHGDLHGRQGRPDVRSERRRPEVQVQAALSPARFAGTVAALAFAGAAIAADFGTKGGPEPANIDEIVGVLRQDPYDLELLISFGTSKGGSAGHLALAIREPGAQRRPRLHRQLLRRPLTRTHAKGFYTDDLMARIPKKEYLFRTSSSLGNTASFGLDFGEIYKRSVIGVRVYGVPAEKKDALDGVLRASQRRLSQARAATPSTTSGEIATTTCV